MDNYYIFNLIKEHKFKQITKLIKKGNLINLDIKDDNYNYFIQYVINYNQKKLLELILQLYIKNLIKIRIDILDIDGRSILYNCIKFNYIDLINILIQKYNNVVIGISILDIKDKLGFTSLHYCIIFNNFEALKILLSNKADPYTLSKDGNNSFFLSLMYKRNDILLYLLNNNPNMSMHNKNGENLLQLAINYNNNVIISYLLNTNINFNNQTVDYGLTALHQSILLDNFNLFNNLLSIKTININITDFYGNTPLHYIIINKRIKYLIKLLSFNNLKFNMSNINGELPLHLLLDDINSFNEIDNDLLNNIVLESDLNFQNNYGETCLMKIINNNLINKFKSSLIIKPLNLFIEDNKTKTITLNEDVIDIAIQSYYNQLKINKDKLIINWEKWCSVDDFEKLKSLITEGGNICIKKIRQVIVEEKRTLPKYNISPIHIDHGIYTNFCFYTGEPIDILFGLILLNNTFKSKHLQIILDYPLTINTELEAYYTKIGLNYPYKLDFSNFEIMWSYQKIFFPKYLDNEINKYIKKKVKYIVIPIGIETSVGSHANILFWDLTLKTIERFEPNGSNYPMGFNYNPELLDNILTNKFKLYDENIIYYPPYKFLPTIGFQSLENLETNKCKKIGDPNGFCGVWCIWWVYQRMININNQNYNINNIAEELIKNIKLENLYFKSVIRNFSEKITSIRDDFLKKYNLDINDWVVGNYNDEILDKIEKNIFDIL